MKKVDLIKILDGEEFEEFAIQKIFNPKYFNILEKSHSERTTNYFIHSNLKPDIKLECKATGIQFWIECKYLQSIFFFNNEEIPVKENQYKRYLEIKEPVFYLYGIGIYAQAIEKLYIIPLDKMYKNKLYTSHIEKHPLKIKQIKNFKELKIELRKNS